MSIQSPDIKPEKEQLKNLTQFGLENLNGWLKNGIDREAVDFCEKFGYCLSQFIEKYDKKGKPVVKSLTSSQIRKVYGEVKRIEMRIGDDIQNYHKHRSEYLLLKPKMAYSAKRDKTFPAECLNQIIQCCVNVVDNSMDKSENHNSFENFCKFFEAIIAYHRAYEK